VVNQRITQLDSFCRSLIFYSFFIEDEDVEQFLDDKRMFNKVPIQKLKSEDLLKKYINAFQVNIVFSLVLYNQIENIKS